MATAPTVQTLDEIMASLQPGYAEQQGIIGKQIVNTDATNKAQKLALDAAKTQGFNQINRQAVGKGNTFSGIPADEQANYLSTTYLPGVQKADADTNAAKLTLEGQAAELNTNQRTTALGVQQNQTGALNSWNLNERNIAATAAENAANRAATAAENAANRAATAASQPTGMSGSQLSAWGEDYAKSKGVDGRKRMGSDGKIAPSEYYAGFSSFYTQTGLGAEDYAAVMSKYVNTSHLQDYRLE